VRAQALVLAALLALAPAAWALPRHDMVESADPRAAEIGRDILREGGSAADAAAAMAVALTLVEPQSAGIGGGAFLVYYSARDQKLVALDGRESAPASARPDRFLDTDGKPLPFFNAMLARGVALAPSPYEVGFCSMAHSLADIERTIEAAAGAAADVAAGAGAAAGATAARRSGG